MCELWWTFTGTGADGTGQSHADDFGSYAEGVASPMFAEVGQTVGTRAAECAGGVERLTMWSHPLRPTGALAWTGAELAVAGR